MAAPAAARQAWPQAWPPRRRALPKPEALTAIERRAPVMPEERQSQLKLLIALGKEQSFLT